MDEYKYRCDVTDREQEGESESFYTAPSKKAMKRLAMAYSVEGG